MTLPIGSVLVDEPGKWTGTVPDFRHDLYQRLFNKPFRNFVCGLTQAEAEERGRAKWAHDDAKRTRYFRRHRKEQP